jgi:branched-chain amino acid transport system ATP-binding protein
VDLALEVASYAYVLQVGRSVLSGAARDLLDNPDVQRIYLGVG